jgi:hypothetical protein
MSSLDLVQGTRRWLKSFNTFWCCDPIRLIHSESGGSFRLCLPEIAGEFALGKHDLVAHQGKRQPARFVVRFNEWTVTLPSTICRKIKPSFLGNQSQAHPKPSPTCSAGPPSVSMT